METRAEASSERDGVANADGDGMRDCVGDRAGEMRPLPPLERDSMSSLMPETVDVDKWEPSEERLRRIAGMLSTKSVGG